MAVLPRTTAEWQQLEQSIRELPLSGGEKDWLISVAKSALTAELVNARSESNQGAPCDDFISEEEIPH